MRLLKGFAKFQFAELNIKETPEKAFSSLELLLYGYRFFTGGFRFIRKSQYYLVISQNATALAAATLRESTPSAIGIFTV